nr:SH3 domain-containing protein [Clostridia bacterium]
QVLNLRETPSLTAKVLGQYYNGTQLFVYTKTGEWYKVSVGAKTGYMMSKYVKLTGASSDAKYKTVVNNNGGSYVNLRCNAGMHYQVLKKVNLGTSVEVLEKGEFWTRVNACGTIGYINNYFLK